MYESMAQAINKHKVRTFIDRRPRFEDAKEVYQAQLSSELFGKTVIDVV